MKVCPKCGHIDRSHWRQNRWRSNVEFVKFRDHPEEVPPKILKKLLEGHPIAMDKLLAYRISRTPEVIERVLRVDYEVGGVSAFNIPREKARSMDPLQIKFSMEEG